MLLRRLLSLLRGLGIVHGGLETADDIVWVLVIIATASGAEVARIENQGEGSTVLGTE